MKDLAYRQREEAKRRLAFLRPYAKVQKAEKLFDDGEVIMFMNKHSENYEARGFDHFIISASEQVLGIKIFMGFRFVNDFGKLTDCYAYVSPFENQWEAEMEQLKNGNLLMMFIDWETKTITYDFLSLWDDHPPVRKSSYKKS